MSSVGGTMTTTTTTSMSILFHLVAHIFASFVVASDAIATTTTAARRGSASFAIVAYQKRRGGGRSTPLLSSLPRSTTSSSTATDTATDTEAGIISSSSHPPHLPNSLRGVIFDLDGTLVEHVIDFADMRRRIYEVVDADPLGKYLDRDCVLSLADQLSPYGREQCQRIFDDITRRAMEDMTPMTGGIELVRYLRYDLGLECAIFTKNKEGNARIVGDAYKFAVVGGAGDLGDDVDDDRPLFHPIVGRDSTTGPMYGGDSRIRNKPHPDAIIHICDVWGCDPSDVIMVGDNAHEDVVSANRAGCGMSVLLTRGPGGTSLDTNSGRVPGDTDAEIRERTPSIVVESFFELRSCLASLMMKRECESSPPIRGSGR